MSEGGRDRGGDEPDEGSGERDASGPDGEFLRNVARVPPLRPPDLVAGTRIDHFVVRSKLGAGAMGVVYEAEDEKLGRTVALKVLSNAFDAEARKRFVREARAASRIVHPSVATIYASGESDLGAYIAMEYVRGETLRDWLRAPRTIAARLRVVREIASALAEAHAAGVVHRDLKPDNVLVTPAESVKVLDFGLAKQSTAGGSGVEETATAEGRIIGTPAYMSPEQAKGMPVDPRSDVFSFGVVLYEVFTGERPFRAETALGVLIAIDRDEPLAPTRVNPETPVGVERVIGRALEKKPAGRYADGAELLRALQALEPTVAVAPPTRPLQSRWFKVLLIVGVLVELIALGAFFVSTLRARAVAGRAVPAAPETRTAGKALTDFTPYGSKNAEALEAYRRGQQAVRSALNDEAAFFDHAAALDPAFAEAHLRAALCFADADDLLLARPHFRKAKQLRAALAPRDLALLDAFEPMVERSPADPHEATTRLRAAAERFPDDAEIAYFTAAAAAHDAPETAPALYERALALDPSFAHALLRIAGLAIASGRVGEAGAALDRCLAAVPDSVGCMAKRTFLDGQRGACADEEADARRVIALAPDWMTARQYLGSALVGEGRSVTAVRELVQQGMRQAPPFASATGAAFTELLMQSEADLLEGRLEAALGRFRAFEPVVAPLADEDAHALVSTNEVILLAEMGRDVEAQAVARDFLARHDAWEPNPNDARAAASDYTAALASYLRRAGVLSKADADAVRAAAIDRWMKRARSREDRELVWVVAYATPADTAEEATEALAALPSFGELPAVSLDSQCNAFVGHALLLAGRNDDALPRLDQATHACDLLGQGWPHLRAAYDLGRVREARGDTAGACAAYGAVVARWGSAKPRSVTGEKALARSKALRCGKTPASRDN